MNTVTFCPDHKAPSPDHCALFIHDEWHLLLVLMLCMIMPCDAMADSNPFFQVPTLVNFKSLLLFHTPSNIPAPVSWHEQYHVWAFQLMSYCQSTWDECPCPCLLLQPAVARTCSVAALASPQAQWWRLLLVWRRSVRWWVRAAASQFCCQGVACFSSLCPRSVASQGCWLRQAWQARSCSTRWWCHHLGPELVYSWLLQAEGIENKRQTKMWRKWTLLTSL